MIEIIRVQPGCQRQDQFPKKNQYILHSSNNQAITENKVPFMVAAGRTKYPGIILANNMQQKIPWTK